jgi:hypothetical protein
VNKVIVFLGWRSTTIQLAATKYYSHSDCAPRLAFHVCVGVCNKVIVFLVGVLRMCGWLQLSIINKVIVLLGWRSTTVLVVATAVSIMKTQITKASKI